MWDIKKVSKRPLTLRLVTIAKIDLKSNRLKIQHMLTEALYIIHLIFDDVKRFFIFFRIPAADRKIGFSPCIESLIKTQIRYGR